MSNIIPYIGKEDYEELQACLGDTFQDINDLKAERTLMVNTFMLSGKCCLCYKIN